MPSLFGAIQRQNGRKVLWLTISFGTATGGAVTALTTTTTEGTRTVPKDALVCFQPTTDVYVRLVKDTAATLASSNTNALKVAADSQEYTALEKDDVAIDAIGASSAGTLKVFLIVPGGPRT